MTRTWLWLLAIVMSASVSPSVMAQATQLNGSASYLHLSREFYVAGLYLQQPSSDPAAILSGNTSVRMKLVVTADRWSVRRWQQQWLNNITINNPQMSANASTQQALMDFTQFLREDLVAGDQVVIDYQPALGTRVLVNNEEAIRAEGVDLLRLLLNTWIGPLPPTRDFRQRILQQANDADAERQQQVLQTQAIPTARLGLVSGWQEQDRQARLAEQERARRLEEQRLAQQRAEQQRQREAREAAERAAVEARAAAAAAAAAERARATAEQQRLAQMSAEQQRAERAAQQRAVEQRAAAEAKRREAEQNAEKTAQQLQAEQAYYLALLQWDLQRLLQNEVTYPSWARQFNQQGLVELDFVFTAQRELVDITVRDEQVAAMLVNEVRRALGVVATRVNVPVNLQGDRWSLSARHDFMLNATASAEVAAAPVPPVTLQRRNVSEQERQQLQSEYRDAAEAKLRASIQYPQAARVLRRQGEVTMSVTIKADGELGGVDITAPSRHRELNQAMQDGANSAAPFAVFPPGMGLESITITVEHRFSL